MSRYLPLRLVLQLLRSVHECVHSFASIPHMNVA